MHRAILGSVERMFAILAEHYQGKWPFWLSPRQIMVIPVHEGPELVSYAKNVRKIILGQSAPPKCEAASQWRSDTKVSQLLQHRRNWPSYSLSTDIDLSGNTFNRKIRAAQMAPYNYVVVVGDREMENQLVNVRPSWSNTKEKSFARFELLEPGKDASRFASLNELDALFDILSGAFLNDALSSKV